MISKNNIDLLSDLTFKTQGYRKNFDLINENDSIVTEYEGTITKLRLSSRKMPFLVGEYSISTWDIRLCKLLDIDLPKLFKSYEDDDIYDELLKATKNNLDVYQYNKVVLINALVIHEDYRKKEITEEFAEMIYRDFYDDKTLVIAIVKPFQDYNINLDYYYNLHTIELSDNVRDKSVTKISASEYYSLNKLIKKEDREMNEYKLFSVVNKCGFSRIGESFLFQFSPEKTIERIISKLKIKQKTIHGDIY